MKSSNIDFWSDALEAHIILEDIKICAWYTESELAVSRHVRGGCGSRFSKSAFEGRLGELMNQFTIKTKYKSGGN